MTYCKEVKKFVLRSLRGSLFELLSVLSMEEDIVDTILSYMNPKSEEANETWKFVETTEEEKATIYRYLSKVYRGMRNGLLINSQVQRSYCTPISG